MRSFFRRLGWLARRSRKEAELREEHLFLPLTMLGPVTEPCTLVSPSRRYEKMVHPEDRWPSFFLR